MPERARVFVIEDNPRIIKPLIQLLQAEGHTVPLRATTLAEALSTIKKIPRRRIGVAIVDGNLTPEDKSGNDGRRIVEEIKRIAPNVSTIGISGEQQDYVDYYVGNTDIGELPKLVTRL